MAAESYVIAGLGTLVTILGGVVAANLRDKDAATAKRVDNIERKQELAESAAHALAIAVAQLTTQVVHLQHAINRLTGGGGE